MKNLYEEKVQKLNDLMVEEKLENNLTEEEHQLAEVIEDILGSDTLYLEDAETGKALVLQDVVNGKIFEAVAVTSSETLNDIVENALQEEEEDEGEGEAEGEEPVQEQDEDEEDEEDEEEEEEEEEEESKEEDFENNEERNAVIEAILNLIDSDNYIIRSHPENNGLVINESSPYYEVIRTSLIERLIDIAETDEEIEFVENLVSEYNALFLEDSGYGLASIEKEELTEGKKMDAIKSAPKKAIAFIKRHPKAAIAAAGLTAAGAGAYAGRKQIKKGYQKIKGTVQQKLAARKARKALAADFVNPNPALSEEGEVEKVSRARKMLRKIKGAPKASKELVKKVWRSGKLGKAGVIAGGAAAAGGAGYGAYKLAKKIKAKRAARKNESAHVKAGELMEGKQSAFISGAKKLGKTVGILKKGRGVHLTKGAKVVGGVAAALGARKLLQKRKAKKLQKKADIAQALGKGKRAKSLQRRADVYKIKKDID